MEEQQKPSFGSRAKSFFLQNLVFVVLPFSKYPIKT
jgi:hypothetical protein